MKLFFLLAISLPLCLFGQSEKTDSLKKELVHAEDSLRIQVLNELAWELKYSDPEEALNYATEANNLSVKTENLSGRAYALHKIGIILWIEGKLESAIDTTIKARKLFRQLNNKKSVASCTNNLAAIYSYQGNYTLALRNYQESYSLKLELNDSVGMVSSLTNIGNTKLHNNEYVDAKNLYTNALALANKVQGVEKYKIADIYNNFGVVYRKLDMIDSSIYYYKKCIKLTYTHGMMVTYAKTLSNLGTLFFKENLIDSALYYYQLAYPIQKEKKSNLDLGRTVSSISDVYRRKGELQKALKFAKEADGYISNTTSLKEQKVLKHLYAQIYADLGDYKKGFEYLNEYTFLNDSLLDIEKTKEVAKLNALYQFERKEKEIQLLKKETEHERKVKKIIIALIILVLISSGLLINHIRLKNKLLKKDKILEEEKSQILKSNLDTQNRELMSNTLNVIQKNELLNKLQTLLKSASKDKEDLKTALKLVKANTNLEKDWENLKLHFEKVHPDFFNRLHELCPELTQNDLRLCSYIKMRLPNKEVARMLNVDTSSIHMSHYRIKKKLKLDKDTDLTSFIEKI